MPNLLEFCQVALPRPVLQTFTYHLPAEIRERARPGMRVLVPFGNRRTVGCIDSLQEDGPAGRVRPVLELLDAEPIFFPVLLELCRGVAEYYVAPLGLVYRTALPPGMLAEAKEGSNAAAAGVRRKVIRLERNLPTLEAREEEFGRAQRQREAYEALEEIGGAATLSEMEALGFSRSVLRDLAKRHIVSVADERVERDPFGHVEAPVGPPLRPRPRKHG
jgi:primosomal protein N' (replication factor Y)